MSTLKDLKHDPLGIAKLAAQRIEKQTNCTHDIAIVCGSGWDVIIPALGNVETELVAHELPGFLPPTVEGHPGRILSISAGDRRVLAFVGRKHLYEKFDDDPVPVEATVHNVRVAAAAGCKAVILTNAVGSLNRRFAPGNTVVIKDHFTRFVPSPIPEGNFLQCGVTFSKRLRELWEKVVHEILPHEGNYIQIAGPHFETEFEAKLFASWKLDLAGMSISGEALAAIERGMDVFAIAAVADYCAEPTSHPDVLKIVREAAEPLGPYFAEFIRRM